MHIWPFFRSVQDMYSTWTRSGPGTDRKWSRTGPEVDIFTFVNELVSYVNPNDPFD